MRFATLVAGIAAVLSLNASSAEAGQARRGPAYAKKGYHQSSAVVVVAPAPSSGTTVVYGHSHYYGCGHSGYYGYHSYGYRPYYRSYYYTQPTYAQPPTYTQPAPAPVPQRQAYDRVNEIGLRGI